jgi:hypothetical protein
VYTGRKFIAFIMMVAITTTALMTRFIGEVTWKDVIISVMLIFVGGNVASKYTPKKPTNGQVE